MFLRFRFILLFFIIGMQQSVKPFEAEQVEQYDFIETELSAKEIENLKLFELPNIVSSAINAVMTAIDQREWLLKYNIKNMYPVTKPKQAIIVQKSTELCQEEKQFIKNRMPLIQATLQKEFGIHQPLRIAFCCGGGGNRAMIGSLGLLLGAAKSKVLDATMYIAGLSGSTWLLAPFCLLHQILQRDSVQTLSTLEQYLQTSLSKYTAPCYDKICTPGLLPLNLSGNFILEIARRYGYNQPLTLVNLFGPFVANYALEFMGQQKLDATWSSLANFAQQGIMPLPLCSSIFQNKDMSYGWFEMSPFQAGSKELGYIPVQYLGSKFKDGILDSNNLCPEYPLSFYLGMYGSAFAITSQEIYNMQATKHSTTGLISDNFFECKDQVALDFDNHARGNLLQNYGLEKELQKWIKDVVTKRNPVTYAQFDNYAQNKSEMLGLFDAGIDFNTPLPLLIDRKERSIDIIIMYDSHPGDKNTLQKAYSYGIQSGVAMPSEMSSVTAHTLNSKTMTVFNDPRSSNYNINSPTLIYFPTKDINIDVAPYITLNFKYSPAEVVALARKMEHAFLSNIDELKVVMKSVANLIYK